jgi:F-type H+-transporting ATPase subunit epsilon
MAKLQLEIVTPEAKIFSEEVNSVVLPGSEGEMGILPQHAALMTQIQPGEVRITRDSGTISLAVGQGFAQIKDNKVAVLTDMAMKTDDIDETKTQEAIDRAQEAIRAQTLVGEELEATQAVLARSLVALNLKRRRHG